MRYIKGIFPDALEGNDRYDMVLHTHCMLLTERYIDALRGRYGFWVEEKERYGNGHSLLYVTVYTGAERVIGFAGMYDRNKELVQNFYQKYQNQMRVWNEMPGRVLDNGINRIVLRHEKQERRWKILRKSMIRHAER